MEIVAVTLLLRVTAEKQCNLFESGHADVLSNTQT